MLEMVDTEGQEEYSALRSQYIRSADVIIGNFFH